MLVADLWPAFRLVHIKEGRGTDAQRLGHLAVAPQTLFLVLQLLENVLFLLLADLCHLTG